MRSYETVVIIDNRLEEAPLEEEITSIEGLITSNQGEVVATERWGSRKLSYEINESHQGNYTLIRFDGEPTLVDVLDRSFKLNDRVLRHMTKRVKKHPAHAYEKSDQSDNETGAKA